MKRWLASIGAVVAGFVVTGAASTAADAAMRAAGLFPVEPRLMQGSLFAVAAGYRAIFAVAGGYTTARLAPDKAMAHVWALAGLGLLAGVAGIVGYYTMGGARLGPAWYPISIMVVAIPCVWLGGRLATHRMNLMRS